MTTINQLPLLTSLVGGDQFVVWSPNNGDSRRVPSSTIQATFLASPTITGTVTLDDGVVSVGAADSGGTGFRVLRVPN